MNVETIEKWLAEWREFSENKQCFLEKSDEDDRDTLLNALDNGYRSNFILRDEKDYAISIVERFGGEGQGDDYWVVFSVSDGESTTFWRIDGWYSSDCGSELDGPVYQVEGVEKVVIVWEATKK